MLNKVQNDFFLG